MVLFYVLVSMTTVFEGSLTNINVTPKADMSPTHHPWIWWARKKRQKASNVGGKTTVVTDRSWF